MVTKRLINQIKDNPYHVLCDLHVPGMYLYDLMQSASYF